MFHTKLSQFSVQKKFNINFQDGSHLGFPIRSILTTFKQQVTSILPMKFWVNRPFDSGENVQNRFSIWLLGRPSWMRKSSKYIFNMAARATIFNFRSEWFKLFLIYKSPCYFLSSFESIGLSVQAKKFKIDFQDGNYGSHLVFPIRMILASFDLQATQMFSSKFQVSWPFGSEEDEQNRFPR